MWWIVALLCAAASASTAPETFTVQFELKWNSPNPPANKMVRIR